MPVVATVGGGANIPLVTQQLSERLRAPVVTTPQSQLNVAAGAALTLTWDGLELARAALALAYLGAVAALVRKYAMPVQAIPGFDLGWWSVQDWSAQQAGLLLPVKDGMRVLDACAAPGGKTAHLLEQADVSLLALDSDGERLERVGHNLRRLGLASDKVQLKRGDAARTAQWWDGQPFDAILADVPCTASGIVRRHPDIRWLRRESDIADTARLQSSILDALWSTLQPGGHFLYSTCSIFPARASRCARAWPPARSPAPSPGRT